MYASIDNSVIVELNPMFRFIRKDKKLKKADNISIIKRDLARPKCAWEMYARLVKSGRCIMSVKNIREALSIKNHLGDMIEIIKVPFGSYITIHDIPQS